MAGQAPFGIDDLLRSSSPDELGDGEDLGLAQQGDPESVTTAAVAMQPPPRGGAPLQLRLPPPGVGKGLMTSSGPASGSPAATIAEPGDAAAAAGPAPWEAALGAQQDRVWAELDARTARFERTHQQVLELEQRLLELREMETRVTEEVERKVLAGMGNALSQQLSDQLNALLQERLPGASVAAAAEPGEIGGLEGLPVMVKGMGARLETVEELGKQLLEAKKKAATNIQEALRRLGLVEETVQTLEIKKRTGFNTAGCEAVKEALALKGRSTGLEKDLEYQGRELQKVTMEATAHHNRLMDVRGRLEVQEKENEMLRRQAAAAVALLQQGDWAGKGAALQALGITSGPHLTLPANAPLVHSRPSRGQLQTLEHELERQRPFPPPPPRDRTAERHEGRPGGHSGAPPPELKRPRSAAQ